MELKERCQKAYESYVMKEFGESEVRSLDFTKEIYLAYTTTEDDEKELQVSYDPVQEVYKNYIDNELVETESVPFERFVNDLEELSFDAFIETVWYIATREE